MYWVIAEKKAFPKGEMVNSFDKSVTLQIATERLDLCDPVLQCYLSHTAVVRVYITGRHAPDMLYIDMLCVNEDTVRQYSTKKIKPSNAAKQLHRPVQWQFQETETLRARMMSSEITLANSMPKFMHWKAAAEPEPIYLLPVSTRSAEGGTWEHRYPARGDCLWSEVIAYAQSCQKHS